MAYTNIDDPSAYFQIATWSGNGSTQSITFDGNSDMQPDWVWSKPRGIAFNHTVQDSSRGVGASGPSLPPNLTNAEFVPGDYVMSLDSDGFSVGAGDAGFNASNDTYVSWCWKANGGTTTNQTGANIDSVTQANTTAGFSIVTYTGNGGAGQSVKHGLGATPQMFIIKRRDGTGDWFVYHQAVGNTKHLHLNTTAAESTTSDFGNYGPDSTSFFVNNTGTCINNETYIAYCFAEKQGYSKFGKYTGNGSSNGTFVYTGFKPAFVMIKIASGTTEEWSILDTKRNDSGNPLLLELFANSTTADYNGNRAVDFLSNGFKTRLGGAVHNGSGYTYIYMAFAENPFVTSTGIPTTAR